jgi:hypothetical protein
LPNRYSPNLQMSENEFQTGEIATFGEEIDGGCWNYVGSKVVVRDSVSELFRSHVLNLVKLSISEHVHLSWTMRISSDQPL